MVEELVLDEWVAGFFDAEGCFHNNIGKKDSYRLGHYMTPTAYVSQSETSGSYVAGLFDGDGYILLGVDSNDSCKIRFYQHPRTSVASSNNFKESLERFTEFCDENFIEWRDYTDNHEERDNYSPSTQIIISRRDHVKRFLEVISPLLSKTKRIQAEIMLQEILPRMERGRHLEKDGFLEIMAWRDLMDSFKGARGGRDDKYDLEYFEDLWGMELPEDRKPNVEKPVQQVQHEPYRTTQSIDEW